MALIYYDSRTGNVERFVKKVEELTAWEFVKISEDLEVSDPGHLITFTTRFGEVPESTKTFLQNENIWLYSVTSSGNTNWGRNFGLAGDLISAQLRIPLLMKFELSGTSEDVKRFINLIETFNYDKERNSKKLDTAE